MMCEGLEGLPCFTGDDFKYSTPGNFCSERQEGTQKQGVGAKIGNGIE